jgi:hypothetical protein
MNTCCNATKPTPTNIQLVQTCLGQNPNKHPVIIDTDTDVDDIWAILYLLNVIKSKYSIFVSVSVVVVVVIIGSNS